MDITTQAIYDYLYEHGRMSGRDICRACGVDAVDVDMAVDCGAIVRTAPAHGGVSPWYCVA